MSTLAVVALLGWLNVPERVDLFAFAGVGYLMESHTMPPRKPLLVLLALVALALSRRGFNIFQSGDAQIKVSRSEVLNQYQRRVDLIPNLLTTVKGGASFEQDTLTRVIEACASAMSTVSDFTINRIISDEHTAALPAGRILWRHRRRHGACWEGFRQFAPLFLIHALDVGSLLRSAKGRPLGTAMRLSVVAGPFCARTLHRSVLEVAGVEHRAQ